MGRETQFASDCARVNVLQQPGLECATRRIKFFLSAEQFEENDVTISSASPWSRSMIFAILYASPWYLSNSSPSASRRTSRTHRFTTWSPGAWALSGMKWRCRTKRRDGERARIPGSRGIWGWGGGGSFAEASQFFDREAAFIVQSFNLAAQSLDFTKYFLRDRSRLHSFIADVEVA